MRVLRMSKSEADATIKPISSFPEWVEASEKMRKLTGELDESTAALSAFNNASKRDLANRQRFEASVERRFSGLSFDDSETPEPMDGMRLQREVNELREAVFRQSEVLDEVQGRCAAEIMKQQRPKHIAMQTRILDAVIELAEALDDEEQFRNALSKERVSTGGFLTIPYEIRRCIGSPRQFSSGVNVSARILADYIGRAPDFSKISS